MGKQIRMIEVGPRDGFQSIKEFIPTPLKLEIIDRTVEAGLREIQATSFISPKAIPQMRDAQKVAEHCLEKHPEVTCTALVPNLRGARDAWDCGIGEVSFIISVSESHNKANVNKTVDESFAELARIRETLPDLSVVLDIVTAFGCPFEGEISYDRVHAHVRRAVGLGVEKACICDTIGIAVPDQVESYVKGLILDFPGLRLDAHIHDTRNMGMLNTLVAIQSGAVGVQSTLGGLGGCPFAPGASGNTATEDLVYMLNRMGYDTGVEFDKLMTAAKYLQANVEGNYSGHQIFVAGCNA